MTACQSRVKKINPFVRTGPGKTRPPRRLLTTLLDCSIMPGWMEALRFAWTPSDPLRGEDNGARMSRSDRVIRTVGDKRRVVVLLLLVIISFGWANAPLPAQQTEEKPDELADLTLEELMKLDILPINVLGTHTHLAGEWMIGYKFMFMRMNGNRDGTDRKTVSDVLQDFPVAPTDMTMAMHMVEVMYAPSNDLTLMAMFPFLQLSMDHVTRSGLAFTTESQGIGDVSFSALYTVYGDVERGRHRLLVIPGLSFPTGSIGEKGETPAGPDQQLPYPMQLGSGTFDLLSGLAYLGESDNWAWDAQAMGTIRLGKTAGTTG